MHPADRALDGRRSAEDVASSCVSAGRGAVDYVAIGRIVAPRGVRGELRVDIETDDPERFRALRRVLVGEEHAAYAVRRARVHESQVLLTLVGVDDRDAAEALRGQWIYVAIEDALPLGEGEYYHFQIVGLQVITAEGEALGRITEILPTGANDVYVIQGPRGEILVPALEGVILNVDLPNGRMIVRLPEGLL